MTDPVRLNRACSAYGHARLLVARTLPDDPALRDLVRAYRVAHDRLDALLREHGAVHHYGGRAYWVDRVEGLCSNRLIRRGDPATIKKWRHAP